MISLISLVRSMFKIGCIGFGGGSALIPIIEKEIVKKSNIIGKEEYAKDITVASITPGALPVEISACIGYKSHGLRGMFLSAVAMALPGALLTVLILYFIGTADKSVLSVINYIAAAVSLWIVYILARYIFKSVAYKSNFREKVLALLIIACVFLLNGLKKLNGVLGFDSLPMHSFSSVNIIVFFLVIIFIISFPKDLHNELRKTGKMDLKKITRNLSYWVFFLIVLIIPAFIFMEDGLVLDFVFRGFISSVISFGGGDAYLSVAEGMFVKSSLLDEHDFYSVLFPIVNALPGSILCKTLSGAGYMIAFNHTGTLFDAVLLSAAGFGVSVFGSCSLSMFVYHAFDFIENTFFVIAVNKWINCVVAGLLIGIIISLLKNMIILIFPT